MSIMQIMDTTGDTEVTWDPNDTNQVSVARAAFDNARQRGMTAYAMGERGKAGEVIRTFDPQAGRIVIRPAMQGG